MDRRQLLKRIAALPLAGKLVALNEARAAGLRPAPEGFHEQSGKVEVSGAPARPGVAIQPGDTITTGAASHAIYIIGHDVHLQRAESVVQIAGDSVRSGLRVVSGKILSVFGKGDKKILTPTATIGIRGTACYIEAEENRIYFCLCYGRAEVAPSRRPEQPEIVETSYHDRPMFINGYGEQVMSPSTVRNHSDAELMMLEALAGRRPAFFGKNVSGY